MFNFVTREDPQETDSTLICFTDGSCFNNGKANASAGFAVHWPYHPELDRSEKLTFDKQTNNRAEYASAIYAIHQADTILDPLQTKTLIIYSDSMLLIDSLSKWIFNWKKNNWRKSDGKQVLNLDLLKELDTTICINGNDCNGKRKVVFRHVKAHTNKKDWESIHNDIVDQMTRL